MALGIFEQLAALNTKIKRLCCKVDNCCNGGGTSTYEVYTALLTQSGSDNSTVSVYGPTITIGITYTIVDDDGDGLWDFTNVGAPNNNGGTSFVATGTTPNSWGSGCWLEYIPAAPVVTVLENTLGGDVVWSYIYPGLYSGTLIGAFPQDKTAMFITNTTWNNVSNAYIFSNGSGDVVNIETYDSANTARTNNILGYTTVEIRVYP